MRRDLFPCPQGQTKDLSEKLLGKCCSKQCFKAMDLWLVNSRWSTLTSRLWRTFIRPWNGFFVQHMVPWLSYFEPDPLVWAEHNIENVGCIFPTWYEIHWTCQVFLAKCCLGQVHLLCQLIAWRPVNTQSTSLSLTLSSYIIKLRSMKPVSPSQRSFLNY